MTTTTTLAAGPTYAAPDKDLREIKQKQGKHGVMFGGDYDWPVDRQVREAYGDCLSPSEHDRRSLAFHTELLSIADAKRAVEAGPERYNSYHRGHTLALLDTLREHPDTDGVRVSFGREGSPVLYLWLPGHTDDSAVADAAEDALGHYTESYEARDGQTKHRSHSSKPDEYSVLKPGDGTAHYGWRVPETADGVLVRMWWD
jgi:hypothetical protein